ncbi:MAG: MDR family oxidoreductase [Rhodothermales bacterium]
MERALELSGEKSHPTVNLREVDPDALPKQGDTLVRIAYSSLNYKDGLAITGKGRIVRSGFPFVPGIDLVGEVVQTDSTDFFSGDWVIGTGWGIGESHWGGYSAYQWLDSEWLVPLPQGMAPVDSMVAGTAGLTALIAIDALEKCGLDSGAGEVLVTGASGGVGSFAVGALAALGYEVAASTGKDDAHDYLMELGAAYVIDRAELSAGPAAPLESGRWAGAIDSVGSSTLAAILAQLKWHASVAVCGLAAGADLQTTVFPFILRGANMLGVDSNTCPNELRAVLWQRLGSIMKVNPALGRVGDVVGLDELVPLADEITAGRVTGRIVVDVND